MKLDRRPPALGKPGGRGETALVRVMTAGGGTAASGAAATRSSERTWNCSRHVLGGRPGDLESATRPALPDPQAQRTVGPAVRFDSPVLPLAHPVSLGLIFHPGELPRDLDGPTSACCASIAAARPRC